MKIFVTLLIVLATSVPGAPQDADLLVRNGRVLDGTGNPDFLADFADYKNKLEAKPRASRVGSPPRSFSPSVPPPASRRIVLIVFRLAPAVGTP